MELILCLFGGFCIGCIFMMFFLLDGRDDTPPIIEPKQPIMLIERPTKELEIYRKALFIACLGEKKLVNDFLQRAKEEIERKDNKR